MRRSIFIFHVNRYRPRLSRGFTLMEMIMVIVIMGAVFSIAGVVLMQAFRAYYTEQEITNAEWQGRIALERIARELRAVRSATAADLNIASAMEIRFIDHDGNGVCFRRSGSVLERSADGPASACGTTNPQPLADNVSAVTFSFWDSAGAATASVAAVYHITVSITVDDGTYSGTYRTNVHPRNF